jgi:hypothetical protein
VTKVSFKPVLIFQNKCLKIVEEHTVKHGAFRMTRTIDPAHGRDSDSRNVPGTHGRSGQQLDIWQAVYTPVGEDGYPQTIWDKRTGEIDSEAARHFKKYRWNAGQ